MTARGLFIAGTDTGVGKTLVAAALMRRLRMAGVRVVGMKPVASGCTRTPGGLVNADAQTLLSEASVSTEPALVNSYAFEPAIAPHIAARHAGIPIELSRLIAAYEQLASAAEVVIVEGAGGWRLPLWPQGFLSDLPRALGLEVILVVALRLGCLNHARLSAEAIGADGTKLLAWVGNTIDPGFSHLRDNVAALEELLPAPCLGIIPRLAEPSVERAASHLSALP